jgi:class 3 adenylate cyclase
VSETKSLSTSAPLLRFAEYLGQYPEARSRPAADLAAEFDLSEDLVRETLAYLGEIEKKQRQRTTLFSPRAAVMWFVRLLEKRPLATTAMACLVFFSMYRYYRSFAAGDTDGLAVCMLFAALTTILAVNFVRGQLRYALYTSGAAVGASLLAILIQNAILGSGTSWDTFVTTAFHALRSTLVFIGFFSVAAVLGAFYRQTRNAAAEGGLDRLELLKRTLLLRDRLSVPSGAGKKDLRHRSSLRFFRSRWVWVAFATGLLLFGVRLVTGMTVGYPAQAATTLQIAVYLLTLMLVMSAYPVVGFISGSPRNGILAGAITFATLVAGRIWLTPEHLTSSALVSMDTFPWAGYAFPMVMLMSWVGGAGAKVFDQQERERMIEESDHAAVVAEIARLSNVLGMSRSEITCLVVDVVQSTKMKKEANPLAVEVSFREYTSFVRREVVRHGGAVQSIAGDGVVAEFGSPVSAFAAARQIQSLIPDFNRTSNTLRLPFRLRIGLHSGSVHGDLEQVSFAEVIDVTAHIEKEAPAGGIMVTQPVRDALPDEAFAELAETIDGNRVYIAQQPTND